MFTLSEITDAISRIADTEIIQNEKKDNPENVKFKKGGDHFIINTLEKNKIASSNLRISKLIKTSGGLFISKEDAETLCATQNIINNTACKVIHLHTDDVNENANKFYITNVYNDRLDQFEKIEDKDLRSANLVVLILSMLLEIAITTKNILGAIDEEKTKIKKEGSHNGE